MNVVYVLYLRVCNIVMNEIIYSKTGCAYNVTSVIKV